MANLIYTSDNKGFRYEDGAYTSTGFKFINEARFERVDGGNIVKDGTPAASFNFAVVGGEMKNLWVNFNDPMDAANVMAQIAALFAALNEENEAE